MFKIGLHRPFGHLKHMAKRKAENQIYNLTPDHLKSGIDPISLRSGDVQHIVAKILTRAITLL
jgi:hypothetical protein